MFSVPSLFTSASVSEFFTLTLFVLSSYFASSSIMRFDFRTLSLGPFCTWILIRWSVGSRSCNTIMRVRHSVRGSISSIRILFLTKLEETIGEGFLNNSYQAVGIRSFGDNKWASIEGNSSKHDKRRTHPYIRQPYVYRWPLCRRRKRARVIIPLC